MPEKVNFQFYNAIAPRYIEPLFLKLENQEWHSVSSLVGILQQDLQIDGRDVVERNIGVWAGIGVGEIRIEKAKGGRKAYFKINELGKYLQEIYSTNIDLFYDLMHYFFYSTWYRSKDVQNARFWIYAQICNDLWLNAPSEMDSFGLASRIQSKVLNEFPGYDPSISERSIRAGFPWLGKLTPPFLVKLGSKSDLSSKKRDYCTPQLFHLAIDLIYVNRRLSYGTSLNIDSDIINDACIVCLLDPDRFWEMAERTQMIVKGFEINKSQWGPAISLRNEANWIKLPSFSQQEDELDDKELLHGKS